MIPIECPNDNPDECADQEARSKRWKIIDLGLLNKIFRFVFQITSDKASCICTILTKIAMSFFDIVSDIIVACNLFKVQKYGFGVIVLIVDYLPGWVLILHNTVSETWRTVTTSKDKVVSISLLLLSPFSSALCHFRWLVEFESADEDWFNYLHHNSRLSQLLNVSYESPLQIVILLILWGNGSFELPWSKHTYEDSQGRQVGIYPGLFSLTISSLSILIGSLDISEGRIWQEKLIVFVYALCDYLFRLPTIALLVLYFGIEWSSIIFLSLIIVSLILMRWYDQLKRQEISTFTSVLLAPISPFIASDQANLYQRTDLNETSNKHRRELSVLISMATISILFLSNIILYLLLVYKNDFITPSMETTLIMDKESTEKMLYMLLLPLGGFIVVSNLIYYIVILSCRKSTINPQPNINQENQPNQEVKSKLIMYAQVILAFLVIIGVISLFCVATYYVAKGSRGKIKKK